MRSRRASRAPERALGCPDAHDLRGRPAHRRRGGRATRRDGRRRGWRADRRGRSARDAARRRSPDEPAADGHRRSRPDAAPRADRRARPLHLRPDRGLDRDDRRPVRRRDPAGRGGPCGPGAAGRHDDRPRRGIDPEPRAGPPRRDRRGPRARTSSRRRRRRDRHHRRPRASVRHRGGRRSRADRCRSAPDPRRGGRHQDRRVGGGDAHDDRSRARPDRPRRPGADRVGDPRDRVRGAPAAPARHEPRPGIGIGRRVGAGGRRQRRARLAGRPRGHRSRRRVRRLSSFRP